MKKKLKRERVYYGFRWVSLSDISPHHSFSELK